ncbi:MAG: tetratricopeptide repeat protein [Bryobacteraceae bacterium]|jgi:tetratricopeptide (TPR) repeat protein
MRDKGLLFLAGVLCATLGLPMRLLATGSERSLDQLLQAATAARLSGHYAQAGELYTFAIRDLEAVGITDVRLARSLLDLGGVREVQGRCQQAADLVLRGLRILEAADQPDPFARSEAWQELGKAYYCQRQYSKADQALHRALGIEQSTPAPRQDRLAEILASQGGVYEFEGRFAEAETAFERAQSIIDQNPRADSMDAAFLRNNLGMLFRMMGRNAESEAAFLGGLALAEAATTPNPVMEIALLDNLASLDLARKQYRDAAARFERALRLLDRGTPLLPRAAGQILRDYAACLRKLGDRSRARTLNTRAAALLSSQEDGNGRLVVDVTELAQAK